MPKAQGAVEQIFILSPVEAVSFGWDEHQIVCWVRAPNGVRHIPTRDVSPEGDVWYGYIETMEPPPHYTPLAWLSEYGSWPNVSPGVVC